MNHVRNAVNAIVNSIKQFTREEDGMGSIEVILIVAVLITFVILMKNTLGGKISTWVGRLKVDGAYEEVKAP